MAVAWRYLESRFTHFLAHLEPPRPERNAVARAAADVTKLLNQRFASGSRRTQAPQAYARIIGSHAKETAVCGDTSVDLLLVLHESYRCADTISALNPSRTWSRAVLELARVLTARYKAVESTAQGWLTVKPRLADGAASTVCVRPAFACGENGYLICDTRRTTTGHTPWRYINPDAELLMIAAADHLSSGKARHLIRMAKAWRRTSRAPISGFALELLACEFLSVWIYRRRSQLYYDWMIRDFFFWLAAQEARDIPLPGSHETLSTGMGWSHLAANAFEHAKHAADLERDNRSADALVQWRSLFGSAMNPTTAGLITKRPPTGLLHQSAPTSVAKENIY